MSHDPHERELIEKARRQVQPLTERGLSEAEDPTRLITTPTAADASAPEPPAPSNLGRYRVIRRLGKGGYGVVYLGHDPELNRPVALKTPRRDRFVLDKEREAFVQEARSAAQLRHPAIVAIHDVFTSDGLPVIVQEFIDGEDLGAWMTGRTFSHRKIAELFIALAAPLGHAHQQGFTHRDLKPANILMDSTGRPHIADFGLALHESAGHGQKGQIAGTFGYMSPEQTRGETHRSDGRTDIWALGVMLYRLLSGRLPFEAPTHRELFLEIRGNDPKPPRQIDSEVPRELERICLKCLAKRRSERYSVVADVAEDLRVWLEKTATESHNRTATESAVSADPTDSGRSESTRPLCVLPKGLRSFDEEDADFFLDLLPGPRDRDGLPESIRFWRRHLEQTDQEKTFSVGLLYGPSGCGKSSLVKAGLLPRLPPHVLPVYVEATARDTEVRLLKQLRRHVPALPEQIELPAAFEHLRTKGVSGYHKVVALIDRFEEWLHAHRDSRQEPLTDALRQCDGGRLQTVVMVRDDFYLSVNRLFQELDIRLLEGRNYAIVDLFDQQHAARVLAAFGRAYGKLPEQLTTEQEALLQQAIEQIAEGGKVISVRLSLVADMMKGRDWTTEALARVGGVSGLGQTFLEETFAAKSAPPAHRAHQQGARSVLKALLPQAQTDLKGAMRARSALQSAAGYESSDRDFEELIAILDTELRLITPTEPDGGSESHSGEQANYYQLTHDYLVSSLRDWLTRKQRETARGRAALRLDDLAAAWTTDRETRHLPSLPEYLQFRFLTDRSKWSPAQVELMRSSGWYYALRSGVVAIVLVLLGVLGYGFYNEAQATRLASSLLSSRVDRLTEIRRQVPRFAWRVDAQLAPTAEQTQDRHRALHAQIGLVERDPRFVAPLEAALLDDAWRLEYLEVIGDALRDANVNFTDRLWEVFHDASQAASVRFRAALALSKYDPADSQQSSSRWRTSDADFLVQQFLSANPEVHGTIRAYLAPNRDFLRNALAEAFAADSAPPIQKVAAAIAVRTFYPVDFPYLTPLLLVASGPQFIELFPLIQDADVVDERLLQVLRQAPTEGLIELERVDLGQRRARAAIALLRKGFHTEVLEALQVTNDPEVLTQFIHRCRNCGVTARQILDLWELLPELQERQLMDAEGRKQSDTQLFAVLLALGEFASDQLPLSERDAVIQRLINLYAHDPSSAVHGASGWLLRHWGLHAETARIDQTPIPYDATGQREWFVLGVDPRIDHAPEGSADTGELFFTFVVFPPGEFQMGSPQDEEGRRPGEVLHRVRLTGPLAVSDREVTWGQLAPFDKGRHRSVLQREFGRESSVNHPVVEITWFESVAYCRWLTERAGWDESNQCYASMALPDSAVEGYFDVPSATQWPLRRDGAGFRLPTESEWEYTCRAGTISAFSFGCDFQLAKHYAWTRDNCDWMHPVGGLRPNLRGIFDLHGNVFEWCHDWSGSEKNEIEIDPSGSDEGRLRESRSGGWDYAPVFGRSASRGRVQPDTRWYDIGFRLVMRPTATGSRQ